jgi:hypothetical protein
VVEEAPEIQKVQRPSKFMVLVLTPKANNYCGYALTECVTEYDELPVAHSVFKVNLGFLERCDRVVVYVDEGTNADMRELCRRASALNKPVELRLLSDANHQSCYAASSSVSASSSELAESNSNKSKE